MKDFIYCKLEKAASELKNNVYIQITEKEFNDLVFQDGDKYPNDNIKFAKIILSSLLKEFSNQNINFSYSFNKYPHLISEKN